MAGDGGSESTDRELESLQQRFLCHHPLADVSCKELFTPHAHDEDPSVIQRKFLAATLKNVVAERYPLPRAYRRDFLKTAIQELESLKLEVLEEIYELYMKLCSYDPDEDFAYKSYKFCIDGVSDWVHIKESRSIACDGSTGVHSWPAGVALANWCLQNQGELKGKVVLELGSGVGMTGIAVIKACKTRTYIFSDYHPQVFKKIRENLVLNNLVWAVEKSDENGENAIENGVEADKAQSDDTPSTPITAMGDVRVMRLDWRYRAILPSNLDYVIGSDLIFEPDLIHPLVETIALLLEANSDRCVVLIAVTERNPDTVAKFEAELESQKLVHKEVEYDSHVPLLWAAKCESVKLYRVSRCTPS